MTVTAKIPEKYAELLRQIEVKRDIIESDPLYRQSGKVVEMTITIPDSDRNTQAVAFGIWLVKAIHTGMEYVRGEEISLPNEPEKGCPFDENLNK